MIDSEPTMQTSSRPARPRCDLVLLTWNRADLLVPCVERILKHTDAPARLIVVDNASTDPDAVAYLDELSRHKGTVWVEIMVVRRGRNDGFAIGMNEGLSRTTAPWLCLLNNDILVTKGWLAEMLDVAAANPAIGLLNPMSNEFNVGPMQPDPIIDEVAERLQGRHGRWLENSVGVGFCVLFSRAVFERIGYFDQQFQGLYYEDTDYSARVRASGLMCAIAEGAYVFHHRQSTMKQHPAIARLWQENEERFRRKWGTGRPERIAYLITDRRGLTPMTAERMRGLANEGHQLWVFHTWHSQALLPRHFKVTPQRLSGWAVSCRVVCRLLLKKKRFHRIIVSRRWLGRLLQWLTPLHHGRVIVEGS